MTARLRDSPTSRFVGWEDVEIALDNGKTAEAVAPVIISASRRTDIPAFYGDWFVERLARGYVTWVNPYSGSPQHVAFVKTRAIVFWTKNPHPFLRRLDDLDRLQPNYYFLYTLNDYDREGWEPAVPPVEERVATFRTLAERVGPDRVVWRFDPLVRAPHLNIGALVERIVRVRDLLGDSVRRLIVSFVDIERYPKVRRSVARAGGTLAEFTADDKLTWAQRLAERFKGDSVTVATCAEEMDLSAFGVGHSRCIDDRLLRRLFGHDRELMAFLGADCSAQPKMPTAESDDSRHRLRDKGQRAACGCAVSKDIGRYDTCLHGCVYCYACSSAEAVERNRRVMTGYPAVLGAKPGTCTRCGMCAQ